MPRASSNRIFCAMKLRQPLLPMPRYFVERGCFADDIHRKYAASWPELPRASIFVRLFRLFAKRSRRAGLVL